MKLNLRNYRTTAYWASVLDVETFEPIGCMKVLFHMEEHGPGRLAVVPETGFEVDQNTVVWGNTVSDGVLIPNSVQLPILGLAINAAANALTRMIGKPVRQGSMTTAWKGEPRNVVWGAAECTKLIREPAQNVARVRQAEKGGESLGRSGMYWLLQPNTVEPARTSPQPTEHPIQLALI